MNHAAQQLPLQMSLADSVTVHERCDLAEAYAQQVHEQRAALEAAQAKLRAENAALRQTIAVLRAELRGEFAEIMRTPLGASRPSAADLTKSLQLAHPDKWSQGQPATQLAHEISVALIQFRQEKGGRP